MVLKGLRQSLGMRHEPYIHRQITHNKSWQQKTKKTKKRKSEEVLRHAAIVRYGHRQRVCLFVCLMNLVCISEVLGFQRMLHVTTNQTTNKRNKTKRNETNQDKTHTNKQTHETNKPEESSFSAGTTPQIKKQNKQTKQN